MKPAGETLHVDLGDGHCGICRMFTASIVGLEGKRGRLALDATPWISLTFEVLGVSLGPMRGGLRTRLLVGGGRWRWRRAWSGVESLGQGREGVAAQWQKPRASVGPSLRRPISSAWF